MKTKADPDHDPVRILLDAAMDIRAAHPPGNDGSCPRAECRSEDPAGGCLPYRTADTVLDLWADRSYLQPTVPDSSDAT
jgi:hypothetical protein